jgi:KipI family sensor histidine kinase inhibitor
VIPHFAALGDRAVTITLGNDIGDRPANAVRAVSERLREAGLPGVIECVPAFASVTVHYDPVRIAPDGSPDPPYERLRRALRTVLDTSLPSDGGAARTVEIPVCYGGTFGPDLDDVAALHGMRTDDVIALHARATYTVQMIGFLPGFPYLGGLPEALATPRRAEPRTHVPAGSVGIGGRQAGIYPLESPGGWNLIGRTPTQLFFPDRDPPTLLQPGDSVRFRPIGEAEFRTWTDIR